VPALSYVAFQLCETPLRLSYGSACDRSPTTGRVFRSCVCWCFPKVRLGTLLKRRRLALNAYFADKNDAVVKYNPGAGAEETIFSEPLQTTSGHKGGPEGGDSPRALRRRL